MSLARVWTNGVASMPTTPTTRQPFFASSDAAKLDQNIQAGVDKSVAGDTFFGNMVVGPGGSISLDSPTSVFASGNGGITTSSGGRVVCGGADDFPTFTASVKPTNQIISLVEIFGSASGPFPIPAGMMGAWFASPTGSVRGSSPLNDYAANAAGFIPITRMHDRSTCSGFTAYFTVNAARTALPARYPMFNLFQMDPFLGTLTSLCGGWVPFVLVGGTLTAYKNGGAPNSVSINTSFTVDDSKYLYFAGILDEDYGADATTAGIGNQFTGVDVIGTASDMRFG